MVSTRSMRNADLLEIASKTPLQETKSVYTVEQLVAFVELARLSPEYGTAVTHLQVSVRFSALDRDVVERYLPACLELVPNASILELSTSPPISITSLAAISLPAIEVLNTNLPHRVLASFIVGNPTLRALEVEACGRARTCALASVDLAHINDIRCLADCAPSVAHGGVDRLRINVPRNGTVVSDVLFRFPAPLRALYVLTLEYGVDDVNVLRAVAANMPSLRHLKLVEKIRSPAHRHKARPWADCTRWSGALQKLTQLEQLVIRTYGTLAKTSDNDAERDVFRRWVAASPPTLRYIAVWQGYLFDVKTSVLSQWSRENGLWQGKWTKNPDPHDFTLF